MPLIHYGHPDLKCPYSTTKFFRSVKDVPSSITCVKCNQPATRVLKGPSSQSIVTVDNGIQARATEVNLELVQDIKDRSTKDFKED